jgi:hypothetical protein
MGQRDYRYPLPAGGELQITPPSSDVDTWLVTHHRRKTGDPARDRGFTISPATENDMPVEGSDEAAIATAIRDWWLDRFGSA